MVIFLHNQDYIFKDFSTGEAGNGVHLVSFMFNLDYNQAKEKIIDDYKSKVGKFRPLDKKVFYTPPAIEVIDYNTRKWNESDAKFWKTFKIGSRTLSKFNVKPLENFKFQKSHGDSKKVLNIKNKYMYGYFKSNGELYKVYTPKSKFKFFTVDRYIQGSEQLTYKKSALIICSSLKDIMALDLLKLDVEAIAPLGEGILIDRRILAAHSIKYDYIYTLLDNDDAGKKAMKKYKSLYGIPSLHLEMSKDLSDSIRDHGIKETKKQLITLLNESIKS